MGCSCPGRAQTLLLKPRVCGILLQQQCPASHGPGGVNSEFVKNMSNNSVLWMVIMQSQKAKQEGGIYLCAHECVHICICVCMYVCLLCSHTLLVCVCIYVCVCLCMCPHVHLCVWQCVHVCLCVCIYVLCMCIHMWLPVCTCVCACVFTDVQAC